MFSAAIYCLSLPLNVSSTRTGFFYIFRPLLNPPPSGLEQQRPYHMGSRNRRSEYNEHKTWKYLFYLTGGSQRWRHFLLHLYVLWTGVLFYFYRNGIKQTIKVFGFLFVHQKSCLGNLSMSAYTDWPQDDGAFKNRNPQMVEDNHCGNNTTLYLVGSSASQVQTGH